MYFLLTSQYLLKCYVYMLFTYGYMRKKIEGSKSTNANEYLTGLKGCLKRRRKKMGDPLVRNIIKT